MDGWDGDVWWDGSVHPKGEARLQAAVHKSSELTPSDKELLSRLLSWDPSKRGTAENAVRGDGGWVGWAGV